VSGMDESEPEYERHTRAMVQRLVEGRPALGDTIEVYASHITCFFHADGTVRFSRAYVCCAGHCMG
jgi:hypothetical protein